MNFIGKITIVGSVAICLGAGMYFAPQLLNNNKELNKTDYSDIYDKIETTTELKKVPFDTAEEMIEYTQKITTINGEEEASLFITDFLEMCSTGKPEVMLTYYNSELWDYVMDNKVFPFYDATGSVLFEAKDIVIKETKNENEYTATYTVVATDSDTKEVIAELERKDTFELEKDFETIKIIGYSRKTTNEKFN